ncbi:hypothetical protein MLD38_010215 [Melastoma candidum]|uniref:Uncharacterized protein n=1 Tax=Melastoma candidum TaxID=119954 RepID=A0ACB9QZ67_9MYRT|nr:hypothetical protein MLD38_010215 [Melastoma candidum]
MASRRDSLPGPLPKPLPRIATAADLLSHDLDWPFGKLEGLHVDDVRETAYEIFFAACRSSPAFSGRGALTHHSSASQDRVDGGGIGNGSPGTSGSGTGSPVAGRQNGVGMAPISKVKKALGLKMLNRSQSKRMVSWNAGVSSSGKPSSPSWHNAGDASSPRLGFTVPPASRPRRPLTSAEIMRQQMRVTELSDNRLRKTLMRTLVGQMGRRVETIILPLELLRHIKPSEFSDMNEYHRWQKRQLKVLEVGLLLHPVIPLEKSNAAAVRLKETIRSCQDKALDIGKNSEAMRMFCDQVVSLSWRSPNGTPTDVCHWADGFPLGIHLYVALLQCVFDMRDETYVMDEVDELLELMKKTWPTMGINKAIHNVCFAWVLFQQYTLTSEIEPDLLFASHAMLAEVSKDAKKPERDAIFVRILTSVLSSIKAWSEKRLHNYHDYFQKGKVGLVESILPLALTASTIYGEEVLFQAMGTQDIKESTTASQDHVDEYIRSSLKNAFSQLLNNVTFDHETNKEVGSKELLSLANKVEELALREREHFTPILKKRHPAAAGVAVLVLHNCYGVILKLYLSNISNLCTETAEVLQRAEKLEKFLVQMVVEDCTECEGLGKSLVKEMVPYEVDRIILMLLKQWTDDRLKKGKECLRRAKETESWNPKSKTEPYAQSAVDLMKLVKEMVDEFFDIPIGITEDLIQDLADSLGHLFQEYVAFVASCGSKQSYLPSLPPLTRCYRSSSFSLFWKKSALWTVNPDDKQLVVSKDGHNPRPSTSRGTQRLYVRLNSLHYLLTHLHSLNKTLSLSPKISPNHNRYVNRRKQDNQASYFDVARASILAACQHVSEVAACRLIFADSSNVLYDSLYVRNVAKSRIRPVLRIMKQNLSLLCAILTDRAQPLAVKEIMKACFEAYLMVLLAGGSSRIFNKSDHRMVEEDFESLKRVFCSSGEGLIAEDLVEREAEKVEGVIALMGTPTEQLIEEFSIVTCEASGIGMMGTGQKLLMPPTTRRWHRSDPNTILRVLCHRNDRTANHFLKKSFHLTKR